MTDDGAPPAIADMPYPPDVEAEVRDAYTPAYVFQDKAEEDIYREFGTLPENIYSRKITPARLAELVALAVEKARAAFLAGENGEEFLRELQERNEDHPQADMRRIHAEEMPKVRTFFVEVAEGLAALVPGLVAIVHAAPQIPGGPFKARRDVGLSRLPNLKVPWNEFESADHVLRTFTALPLNSLNVLSWGARQRIREPLKAAGLTETEIDAAAQRIRAALLDMARAFPFGRPFPAVRWKTDSYVEQGGSSRTYRRIDVGTEAEITDVWAYVTAAAESYGPGFPDDPTPGERQIEEGGWITGTVLSEIFQRQTAVLVAQEAAAAGEARVRSHVAVPADRSIPILFTGGVPFRDQLKVFQTIENEDADGALESVSFGLEMARDDEAQLTFHGEGFLRDRLRKRPLSPGTWRSEALSLLPEILGPEALALYYATWQGVDSEGDFAFHPAPFLELFGMKDDSRARKRLEAHLRTLTLTELKIVRKYGPSMGGVGVKDEARLIEESSFKRTLIFPGRPRLNLSYFRHAPPMLEIQRAYHVRVPKEAFRLVGGWREGAGVKSDGVRAFSLVAAAYVLARTFATRDGKQGARTFRGAAGYEIPLEEILTASGFTTPKNLRKNPGAETERAAETVERITREFRLFGPGTLVRGGRFRFDSPESLRGDLARIVASKDGKGPPEPLAPTIDVPPRPRRRRSSGGRKVKR